MTNLETLPFAGVDSQELAGTCLDTISDFTLASTTSERTSADTPSEPEIAKPLVDSNDHLLLFVQLPDYENSAIYPIDDVPLLPDMCESKDLNDMSSDGDRVSSGDQVNDCRSGASLPINSSDLNSESNDIDLRTFNYCVNLPKISGKKIFDSIDNLFINFAGNYQSSPFTNELSMLIIKHFNLNIDLSDLSEPKFNNLKKFDFNKSGAAPVDYNTMSNRRVKRLKYSKFQFLFKRNRSLACRQALDRGH